jgi:CubicO group peptidase (beta-lactamase class C family)
VFVELARNRLAALQQDTASKPQAASDTSRPATPVQSTPTAQPTPAQQTPASVSPVTREALLARMTAYSIAPNEREGQARDYERSAGHKAIAVSIENRRTYRTATWATATEAEIGALEGCQIEFGKPCALIAVDDEVQRAGPPTVRDMPRLNYNGTFDLAQIPKGRPVLYQRADIINYKSAPEPKAAAFHHRFDTEGALFVVAGGRSQFEVEEGALAQCNNNGVVKDRQGGPCFLYAVGNQVVLPKRSARPLSERRVATSASPPAATAPPQSPPQTFQDRLLARFAALSVPATDAEKKQARDYEADAGHKAVAVAPAAHGTFRATNRPSDETAVAAALESCQFYYREPCILAAVSKRIEPASGGISAPRDMPRTRYTGLFDPEQIPATDVHLWRRPDVVSYRSATGPKAAAFHPWGRLFIAVGGGDQARAEELALSRCNNDTDRKGQGGPCFLYAVGNQVVLPQRSEKPLSQRRSDSPKLQQAAAPLVETAVATTPVCIARFPFGYDEPERQGVDLQKLLEVTQWLRENPAQILSLTISHNGKVVYELYSSRVDRDAAHYLMSVTKTVTAALVGAALDRHLVKAASSTVAENLPRAIFPSTEAFGRFQTVTLKDVLGMSALDAQVAPRQNTPEARDRSARFFRSPNRLRFALEQGTLAHIGEEFQYTDVTPVIASGVVQLATNKTLLDFGKQVLFDPMGFQNEEWMHQDATGFDNPSYGLRLRPIDMQKFGILFLNNGCWERQQLISKEWALTSFTPWIKSRPDSREPDYGWYWWTNKFGSDWIGHTANGWKGQRITVVPDKGVVVTMTGIIEDGTEDRFYDELFNRFIIPAFERGTSANEPIGDLKMRIANALNDIRTSKTAIGGNTEARMIPSASPKEPHHEFRGMSP